MISTSFWWLSVPHAGVRSRKGLVACQARGKTQSVSVRHAHVRSRKRAGPEVPSVEAWQLIARVGRRRPRPCRSAGRWPPAGPWDSGQRTAERDRAASRAGTGGADHGARPGSGSPADPRPAPRVLGADRPPASRAAAPPPRRRRRRGLAAAPRRRSWTTRARHRPHRRRRRRRHRQALYGGRRRRADPRLHHQDRHRGRRALPPSAPTTASRPRVGARRPTPRTDRPGRRRRPHPHRPQGARPARRACAPSPTTPRRP